MSNSLAASRGAHKSESNQVKRNTFSLIGNSVKVHIYIHIAMGMPCNVLVIS